MKAAVDVQYRDKEALAACVLFSDWRDARPARELVVRVPDPAPYQPGEFYKRELPCLLAVLEPVKSELELVIVDGYVWLDAQRRRGLGAHLHEALGGKIPVIGVAKTSFAGDEFGIPVQRNQSARPLYVTAVGISPHDAADHLRALHGEHRLPTLLKRVDRLARGD